MEKYNEPQKIIRIAKDKVYQEPKRILKASKTENVTQDFSHVSKERREEEILFITNRTWGSTYTAKIAFREIESSVNDDLWLTHVYMSSTESGNMVYKKYMYHKKRSDAANHYDEAVKIVKALRNEQEINNIPTSTIPNMLWYSLKDLHGDVDLKPKSAGNILYLRQDHNVKSHEDSKGNLFKNIVYLDKADNTTVEHTTDGLWTDRQNYF
jgi:hypothetical protein